MAPVHEVAVEIGGATVRLRTESLEFRRLLETRYEGFLVPSSESGAVFDVELGPPSWTTESDWVEVSYDAGCWTIQRSDFHATYDPRSGRGVLRQPLNPYSVDSVLRIVHTLILAGQGGFLLHAASVVRSGRAFLFSGVSGAGKTTLSRLVPPGVTLLTDEISYVRPEGSGYRAFGTPFAGELAKLGENVSAPVATLYLLAKGAENRIEPVDAAEAGRSLLRNILFFAEDPELVRAVFRAACDFISKVPVYRLTFLPDQRVWELIQ